jgi:hypothetical protein
LFAFTKYDGASLVGAFFFFFLTPLQFCDIAQVVIIYDYIFTKFGEIENIKVENMKLVFVL